MHNREILSTGVLTTEPKTVSAVINIVNIDKCDSHEVIVEVWDWSSYHNPVKIPVLIGENENVIFPYSLAPSHLAVLYADLAAYGVTLYEIRVIHFTNKNIISNCFGRSIPPYTSQEGNTVLQKQMIKLE